MKAALVMLFILAASIAAAYLVLNSSALKEARMGGPQYSNFKLDSPAFAENGDIPAKYTCKGENVNPPLKISGVPEGTESLALILHDPDAPGGDFLHWSVWNINPAITTIAENVAPSGATQGMTDFGKTGYGGPCPPSGTHHYEFDLYTLNVKLDIPSGASRRDLEKAMNGHTITQTKLVGVVTAH